MRGGKGEVGAETVAWTDAKNDTTNPLNCTTITSEVTRVDRGKRFDVKIDWE